MGNEAGELVQARLCTYFGGDVDDIVSSGIVGGAADVGDQIVMLSEIGNR